MARALIERYSKPGELVLDPFCGSGTLMVEAVTLGRNAVGSDIDPIAVFISRVKTQRIRLSALHTSAEILLGHIDKLRRADSEYLDRQFHDLTDKEYRRSLRRYEVEVPQIPNVFHWFRCYVLIDLARLRQAIQLLDVPRKHKDFLMLCFGAIIRNSSNADPVPVSGLEVTSYMKEREANGRIINPFALYERSLARSLKDVEQFCQRVASSAANVRVLQADATQLGRHFRQSVDAVITSPPYHNAVDYYRRHTLEMYWLNFVTHRSERLALLPRYIGRSQVAQRHSFLTEQTLSSRIARRWEAALRNKDSSRADAFKHYIVAMQKSLEQIAKKLPRGKPAVFVLGKSSWNSQQIPTVELFEELSVDQYTVVESYWYPLKNRYMSYRRHNNANINKEYVIVLERK